MTLAERLRFVAPIVLAATLILALRPTPAAAQSVEAESLFQEGRRLLKEGKIAEACDKLEASERLETSIGTLLNLADCREKNGQFATAWATFLKAAAAAKRAGNDAKRETEARRRANVLAPRMAYLTISVPDASKVDGLVVSRNGVALDPALWNQGVPVDPGVYEITGQAPGHEPWSTKVTISDEGQKASVEVPRFKQLEDLVPPEDDDQVKTPPVDAPDDDDDDSPGRDRPGRFTTMRKISIGVAVVGLAAIGGGVVFGLDASDLESQANQRCPEAACNDMMAIQLNEDAQSAALKANLLIGVGGLAVAGAVAMWFLGAPDERGDDEVAIAPVLGGDRVGVSFAGRF